VSSRRLTFRDYFWVDSDLKVKDLTEELTTKEFADEQAPDRLKPWNLRSVVGVLRDVAQTEFDREMNLNTRAAAVAAVAGLIATASGAVGKSVFETTTASDPVLSAIGLFLVGLVAVVTAMFMAVMGVLRPKKAPTRQMFFTDTLVGIWRLRNRSTLSVEETDLNELLGDRLLQTIALWSLRNREKARWLRRAWLFLALGVLLISVAGLLVVAATLKDYSDLDIFGIVAVGLILVWTVLRVDWFFTDRGGVQHAEDQELERIASKLLGDDRRRPFADRDGRHRPRATSG
jgi:hypothetical protein